MESLNNNKNYIKFRKYKSGKIIPLNTTHKLSNEQIQELSKIYIPPAYKHTYYNKYKTNKIRVICIDNKNRTQYIYSDKYKSLSDKRKYCSLKPLIKNIKLIKTNMKLKLKNIVTKMKNNKPLTKEDIIVIIINLLLETSLRVGNIKYEKEYNTYGITTLKPSHLKFVKQNKTNLCCKLNFIGKKGVENNSLIHNLNLCYILHKLKQKCKTGYMFKLDNTSQLVSGDDITIYFKDNYDSSITPKYIRTYMANYHTLNYINQLDNNKLIEMRKEYKTDKKYNSQVKKQLLQYVSQILNNTPTVCKNKYINKNVLEYSLKILSSKNIKKTIDIDSILNKILL